MFLTSESSSCGLFKAELRSGFLMFGSSGSSLTSDLSAICFGTVSLNGNETPSEQAAATSKTKANEQ